MSNVAIVIPVYGSGPYVTSVVSRLREQVPSETDIVVSHSGLPLWFADQHAQLKARLLHSDSRLHAGPARNRGASETTSEWIAFVDEDILVRPDWYAALMQAIERGDADCIVGPIAPEGGGYWGQARWFIEFNSIQPGLKRRVVGAGASANMVIRRKAFESVDGFPDWRMSQDTGICRKLTAAGATIVYEPTLVGAHQNPRGFRKAARHLYHQGRHAARVALTFPAPGLATIAAKSPVLAPIEGAARLYGMGKRCIRAGSWRSMLFHMPGILMLMPVWITGFALESAGHKSKSRY